MGWSCLAMSALVAVAVCARTGAEEDRTVVRDGGILIDVRTAREFKDGHLDKAINIPHTEMGEKIAALVTNKGDRIVLYCRSGNRSGIAEGTLRAMGYTNVVNAGAYARLKEKEDKAGPANALNQDRKVDGRTRKTD
jgi:phage shock protein E